MNMSAQLTLVDACSEPWVLPCPCTPVHTGLAAATLLTSTFPVHSCVSLSTSVHLSTLACIGLHVHTCPHCLFTVYTFCDAGHVPPCSSHVLTLCAPPFCVSPSVLAPTCPHWPCLFPPAHSCPHLPCFANIHVPYLCSHLPLSAIRAGVNILTAPSPDT